MKAFSTAVVLGLLAAACGGSSSPPPSSAPPATTANPCTTSLTEDEPPLAPTRETLAAQAGKRNIPDGSPRGRVLDHLWTHRVAEDQPEIASLQRRGLSAPRNNADVGDVAVVQDEGDLILPPNTYDLKSFGLRFTRNSGGGYNVTRIEGLFRAAVGNRVTLTDDDSTQQNVPFGFSFYGKNETVAFVNSDGNITFEDPDKSSTERNVARLLTGPPRVAPFLADLDPTAGSGRIFVNAASDQYTVTWCNVNGFDSQRTVTVQTTLLPSGNIEMIFGAINLGDAIVGLSPGHTATFSPVNLSDAGPTNGGSGAVGERFAESPQLDVVAVARKFYRTHPDNYDQVVLWTDQPVITDAFAYETTVKNEVKGIGVDTYDLAGDYGSGGRLRSVVVMDWLGKYPDDPQRKFLGENNTVSLLGQECGHRWLAFLEFFDRTTGTRSDVLLGRDLAHWSFFFDSDASVMEGNDIEDLGGGSFRTAAAVRRYSALDQYAMGLLSATQVPPFFYVESPTNMSASRTRESAPEVGITFNGTRRDVLIDDVVAVLGTRSPAAAASSREHRQAFIYLVSSGRSTDAGQVAKVDNFRKAWETFFLQATDGRMRAITTLQ